MAITLFGVIGIAHAGTVRSVQSDATLMVPINLRMGESTVLRFLEKPKKLVLGNSNYYSVEFIDNDVAIQPLGTIATNLFVYGAKNVYGFLLKTSSGGGYDDLIHVRWKESQTFSQATAIVKVAAIHEVSRPGLSFTVGKSLNITVTRIQRYEHRDFYIVDLMILNKTTGVLDLKNLRVDASRKKVKLSPQEFFIRDKILKPGQTTSGRIFLNINKIKDLALITQYKNDSATQIISGKMF